MDPTISGALASLFGAVVGGTTEVGIISLGGMVYKGSVRVGVGRSKLRFAGST